MPTKSAKLPIIAFFVFDRAKLLDVTGPLQVFADARRDGAPAYQVGLFSLTGQPVMTDAEVALPTQDLAAARRQGIDTLLVSGGDGAFDIIACNPDIHALTGHLGDVRRLGSICTGAFVLAACGQLQGRQATTHWAHCDDLAARYPGVTVRSDAIFVQDGPVWTSAGVTTGIDMAMAMVEKDLGLEEALRLARSLVLYLKRPGGQEQFSAPLRAQVEGVGSLGPVLSHIRTFPADDLCVARLAALSGLGLRTFLRRFQAATGSSPASFVESARVDAACEAFSSGLASVKQVASLSGFGGEERMRRAFQRVKGIAPSQYRERFSR